jgi:hypothetical protein
MKARKHIRFLILCLFISASLLLIGYTRTRVPVPDNKDCIDGEKCPQNKVHSEFILWESISRNLFGNNN